MDYNEIWLEAMDTLIAQRLSNLPFDQTIVCSVVDSSTKAEGRYIVSNGSIEFEAQSEYTHYLKDDKVYVIIPNGDWGQKKQIIGRYSREGDKPIAYVPPTEQVVEIIPDIVNWSDNEKGLIANDTEQELSVFAKTDLSINTVINNTICIKADFKCLLDSYDMRAGGYGLAVRISAENATETINIDSELDMFGNPYAYTGWTAQEQAFKLTSSIGNIIGIEAVLYQKGDFKYFDGGEEVDVPVAPANNILIRNLQIYFGADVTQIKNNTVEIYTNDSDRYNGIEGVEKTISLIWYNKTEDNKLIGFEENSIFEEEGAKTSHEEAVYYWIEWYKINKYGNMTEKLDDNDSDGAKEITTNCYLELLETDIYAIVWRNGNQYRSNTLTFKNQQAIAGLVSNEDITVHITPVGPTTFAVYGEDNELIIPSKAYEKQELSASWNWTRGVIGNEFWQGSKIIWKIPKNSMILPPRDIEPQDIDDDYWYYEQDFVEEKDSVLQLNNTFYYYIAGVYNPALIDNTIICEITREEWSAPLRAELVISFSSIGNTGTEYTIVIEPQDLIYTDVDAPPSENLFTCKLISPQNEEVLEADFTKSFSVDGISPNSYNVLTVSTDVDWAERNVKLTHNHPIIFSLGGAYHTNLPNKFAYDNDGKLKNLAFSNLELQLTGAENVTWQVIYYPSIDASSNEALISNLPHLGKEPNILVIPTQYIATQYKTVLIASIGEMTVWSAPIILEKYLYNSEVLNNWTGKTVVDTENNQILTSTFVAGYMDEDNLFNGAIIGAIGKISENVGSKETGIFGYSNGQQSYGFRDNGTAFLGKSGKGRIYFNGNSGIIESAGDTGMKIDLSNGLIQATNFKLEANNILLDSAATNGYLLKIGTDKMTLDSTGNLKIQGDITGSNGTFNGSLRAGGFSVDPDNGVNFQNTFKVRPDGTIIASGGTFTNITANGGTFTNITATGGTFTSITATGTIAASSIDVKGLKADSSGTEVGGWYANNNGLYSTNNTSNPSLFLYPSGSPGSFTVGNTSQNGWVIWSNRNFGVDKNGILHASGAVISGRITATEGGNIGGWQIEDNTLSSPWLDLKSGPAIPNPRYVRYRLSSNGLEITETNDKTNFSWRRLIG